ncbi:septum site-determining protein MinC [Cronbergia sp. UHCC 0137]|uniref:septum site-determining protein MinC n=1 Tax=Cronbergia sp. UHCC 0137 TaxID=3110239 RepID=UPI002B2002B7|nr:septum site-determining protein MinC [Cronbergia sp. UHCC 0137]MEA5617856.1 septum site-determining protein MinC [Cronbergia sp. UHCC 0137]
MNSDSATPQEKIKIDLNSALNGVSPPAEPISTQTDINIETDNHSIIPSGELNSVLVYLKGNSNKLGLESNSDLTDLSNPELGLPDKKTDNHLQVQLKTQEGKLLLILPPESQVDSSEFSWSEIWQQMKQRLNAGERLRTGNTILHLNAQDRLLDSRQLQELGQTLSTYQIQLKSVATSRRQTAIAACTLGYSVEQIQPQTTLFNADTPDTLNALADALYLEMTIRSGVEIRHPGTVIILGDINPGGNVVADGDILVWGRLRGIAHAGAKGNRECLIMALQMKPTQLRIADAVARSPEKQPQNVFPEVAYITPEGIRIAKANDFSRSQLTKINQKVV